MINANRIVSGSKAEIRAYGFSGNRPYHFSSKYLIPCAIRIENGKIKNITASGLNPVMTRQKISRIVAIEFLDAKKPFVVENKPIKANAKSGKLSSGDKNTLSRLLCQENTGDKPAAIFPKKSPSWKFSAKSNSIIVAGW